MNELMAGLYYVAATSPPPDDEPSESSDADAAFSVPYGPPVSAAEAASFACFVPMLAELRDLFCASLDGSAGGVAGAMASLTAVIADADAELAAALASRGVNPQFYAFRWITTALTQEFPLPDAIRAWDALLADPAGPRDSLLRIAAAMVLHLREQLLAGDFAANVKLLQAYPPSDVNEILRVAQALPRGGGPPDGGGGSGPPPEWAARAGLKPQLKAGATWAERKGADADAWVKVTLAPQQPQP